MDSQIRLDTQTCYLQQILSIQDLLDIDNNMSPYGLLYCIYPFIVLVFLLSLLSRMPYCSIHSLSSGLLLYSNYSLSFVTFFLYTPYCLVWNNRLCRYKQSTLYALVHQFFLSHWCPRLVSYTCNTSSFYLTGVPAITCFCTRFTPTAHYSHTHLM